MKIRISLLIILVLTIIVSVIVYTSFILQNPGIAASVPGTKTVLRLLDKYTYESLRRREYLTGNITFGRTVKETPAYRSLIFYYTSDGKKVSGLMNIPKAPGTHPVIVMIRGFVDLKIYSPGVGTQHAGEVFAQNGYITLAPDFLGYGESDNPSANPFEERFETYTTVLNLLASISNPNSTLQKENSGVTADTSKVGIWGHSNGGQVALSVLEISGKAYPTVLWAPVSKSFPYSILYFTDESDDQGKRLRKVLSGFEKDYDTEKYSPANYLNWINAPMQLHQGGNDEEVPLRWSNDLYKSLKSLGKDITYFTYPAEDHNFSGPEDWSLAVSRSLEFYKGHFGL